MEDDGQAQKRRRTGNLVSVTSSFHASSEKQVNNNGDMNVSETKRAVKKTADVKIRKSSRVVPVGVNGRDQRFEKLSTAAVDKKVQNVVTKVTNKTTKKRRHDDVENTSDVHLDMNSTVTTKKTVNSCTKTCTELLGTGNVGRKVSDVQCKRIKTRHEVSSLSSSFGATKKSRRKTTGSIASGGAAGKQVSNIVTRSKAKINVTDTGKKTFKEHKEKSSCVDFNVSLCSKKSRRKTIGSIASGRAAGKQVSNVVTRSKAKINVTDTGKKTFKEHKEKSSCVDFNMSLSSKKSRRKTTGCIASGGAAGKQVSSVVTCSKVKINVFDAGKKTLKAQKERSSCANLNVSLSSRQRTSQFPAAAAVYNHGDSEANSRGVKDNVAQSLQKTSMKHERDDKGSLPLLHMTLRPRRQRLQYSVLAGEKSLPDNVKNSQRVKDYITQTLQEMSKSHQLYDNGLLPSLHMTLRPRRQRLQYSVLAGEKSLPAITKSQTASVPVGSKRRSRKSEYTEHQSGNPCWNGGQKQRCSKS